MKITKEYLKQIIKEELEKVSEADNTDVKPGSPKFEEVRGLLAKRINPMVGGVSKDLSRIAFPYQAHSKGEVYNYIIELDIKNPENNPKLKNTKTNKEITDFEKIKKGIGKLFEQGISFSDVLKIIVHYQHGMRARETNKAFLEELGWL